jgi:enamine deaminase RidA (YjgF/YER057c/UK114 family)
MMRILAPAGWPKPRGYSDGIAARGTVVAIAGQVGWDERRQLAGPGFVEQARQALENIRTVLAEEGGEPRHIIRMTWFVTSKAEYLADRQALGEAYRSVMGKHYPAMTAVQVVALMVRDALVEIEATAVIPDRQDQA